MNRTVVARFSYFLCSFLIKNYKTLSFKTKQTFKNISFKIGATQNLQKATSSEDSFLKKHKLLL